MVNILNYAERHLLIILPVFPTTQVSAPGGNAVLVCLPSSTDGLIVRIKWLFNGTVYDGSSVNVSTTFSETTRTGRLILRNISKDFNATRIQCTAFTSIHMAVTSSAAVLVIQGMWIICIQIMYSHTVFFLENSPRGGKMEIFGFEGGQSELGV